MGTHRGDDEMGIEITGDHQGESANAYMGEGFIIVNPGS